MKSRMTRNRPSHVTRNMKDRQSVTEDAFRVSKANDMGCDLANSRKKHVQPTHRTTEQQRLRQ
eukprot:15362899-Ditylum_brightwellii.AAC.1